MTIKKGESWGEPATAPAGALPTASDREISLALDAARRAGDPFPEIIITGGDMGRTLAATGTPQNRFTIDVGEALVDGLHHYFVAHVIVQPGGGWRKAITVMNAQWCQGWNLGPKGHPNDGRLDVSEFSLQLFEWRKVRARLGTGTHVPHPRIETRRTAAVSFEFPKPTPVMVDGVALTKAKTLALRVIPDALTVYA